MNEYQPVMKVPWSLILINPTKIIMFDGSIQVKNYNSQDWQVPCGLGLKYMLIQNTQKPGRFDVNVTAWFCVIVFDEPTVPSFDPPFSRPKLVVFLGDFAVTTRTLLGLLASLLGAKEATNGATWALGDFKSPLPGLRGSGCTCIRDHELHCLGELCRLLRVGLWGASFLMRDLWLSIIHVWFSNGFHGLTMQVFQSPLGIWDTDAV